MYLFGYKALNLTLTEPMLQDKELLTTTRVVAPTVANIGARRDEAAPAFPGRAPSSRNIGATKRVLQTIGDLLACRLVR